MKTTQFLNIVFWQSTGIRQPSWFLITETKSMMRIVVITFYIYVCLYLFPLWIFAIWVLMTWSKINYFKKRKLGRINRRNYFHWCIGFIKIPNLSLISSYGMAWNLKLHVHLCVFSYQTEHLQWLSQKRVKLFDKV